ncbi:arginine--tRNA ligase [Aureibacter tunicatorum]|uniref:Arginine--tRNA ligase n=1 Tax=Aureibacter tunicatorum TaxID=866807 RepID=A0AAE3XQQ5_9BACT|nr:arginine--tRNA ligase [Aureibacter tunicatorum]MDR6240905.1 arginyl-tRNA synthetase [Aureibacter tunicatorum]BDD03685.1 arginine--tRNA ligase [Aureibacter tunicatorum]
MQIQEEIKKGIQAAFESLFSHNITLDEIALQPTRKEFEGSFTFVTFPFARISKKNPVETAELIGKFLTENNENIKGYNVVKGFLNLEISDNSWIKAFESSLSENFGQAKDNGQSVIVEYSSPNTNKPLHLGHLRNNFLGYSVAEILKACGYKVTKANLVNDRGIHICKSMLAYQKFGENETPESSGIKGDKLIGNYYVRFDKEYKKEIGELVNNGKTEDEAKKEAPLMLEAQEMLKKWEDGDTETVSLWKKMNGWVYQGFDQTYATMGVDFDKYYYESDTYLLGKDIVDEGLEKNVFFKKDNGSVWADLSNQGLDEKLVLRSDGTSVYITQDLGTADLKFKDFNFDKSIYVVGNEQDYHFDVLFKILKNIGRSYAEGMYHLSYGMVDLPSGKMKSREGTVVDADDLMQEMFDTAETQTKELGKIDGFTDEQAQELYKTLGLGALKYFLLKVDPKKRMLFNPQESIQFQGNTGPFIQYTHARISAILRKAKQLDIDLSRAANIENLEPIEAELVQLLTSYPEKVLEAGKDYSPAIIAQYAYDLAKEYNRFYTELTIFGETDEDKKAFRVALSKSVAQVISKAMGLLGINVPDRM